MTIVEKIVYDRIQARKAGDKQLSSVLGCLLGEITIVGKNDGNRSTTDQEALQVISKFRKDAGTTGDKIVELNQDRDQSVLQTLAYEIEVYERYLPEKMSQDELQLKIKEFIEGKSNINKGKIMGWLSSNFKGLYDGKEASLLIDDLLN